MAVTTDISCVIPRPDIAELHDQFAAEFSRRLLGGGPVLAGSAEDVYAFIMSGASNLFYGMVTQALEQQDPVSMCCDNLIRFGSRRGMPIRSATRAKGYVTMMGTPGAGIPQTLRLVGQSSREYKPDPAIVSNPTHLDSSGRAAIRLVAALPGAVFNLPAGATLTVATTSPGIEMQATIVGNGLTGGSDDEDCETYRTRVVGSEDADPIVVPTNEAWFLGRSMTYPGVTRVCTDDCGLWCDSSFRELYPFFEGVYPPYGVPPQGVLDEMGTWMFGREPGRGQGLAPMGIRGAYLAAQPVIINVFANCFRGCEAGVEDRIRDALTTYLRDNFCTGSTICRDQLHAVVTTALGPAPCLSGISFGFAGGGIRHEDAGNVHLDCGRFPVLGMVNVLANG